MPLVGVVGVVGSKIGSTWDNRTIFSPELANVSPSDKPRVEFSKVWESPEKIKNLKLIEMAQKRNREKRKHHTSFFILGF